MTAPSGHSEKFLGPSIRESVARWSSRPERGGELRLKVIGPSRRTFLAADPFTERGSKASEDFRIWSLRAYELRRCCIARRVRRIAAAERRAGGNKSNRRLASIS